MFFWITEELPLQFEGMNDIRKILPERIGTVLKRPSALAYHCGTLSASLLDHSLRSDL